MRKILHEMASCGMLVLAGVCMLGLPATARGEVEHFYPSKDATLLEDSNGSVANALGDLFAGRSRRTGDLKRSLLAFDLAGTIPAGATIDSVTLRLRVDKSESGSISFSLHELLANWGEGTSNAGNSGEGTNATNGDATWLHTFYSGSLWTNPGGDFEPVASAIQTVGNEGLFYTWGSTPDLVGDVQGWLDDPGSNYGWALIGNESASADRMTKRFNSGEDSNSAYWPMLTVEYTAPVPEPSTLAMIITCFGAAAALVWRRRRS